MQYIQKFNVVWVRDNLREDFTPCYSTPELIADKTTIHGFNPIKEENAGTDEGDLCKALANALLRGRTCRWNHMRTEPPTTPIVRAALRLRELVARDIPESAIVVKAFIGTDTIMKYVPPGKKKANARYIDTAGSDVDFLGWIHTNGKGDYRILGDLVRYVHYSTNSYLEQCCKGASRSTIVGVVFTKAQT